MIRSIFRRRQRPQKEREEIELVLDFQRLRSLLDHSAKLQGLTEARSRMAGHFKPKSPAAVESPAAAEDWRPAWDQGKG